MVSDPILSLSVKDAIRVIEIIWIFYYSIKNAEEIRFKEGNLENCCKVIN